MSSTVDGRATGSQKALARAREPGGRFAAVADPHPSTPIKRKSEKRLRTERDYMRRIVQTFELDEMEEIVAAIKADAIDGDDKVRNAAREWVGKYLLGNARVMLEDVDNQPAIVKRR